MHYETQNRRYDLFEEEVSVDRSREGLASATSRIRAYLVDLLFLAAVSSAMGLTLSGLMWLHNYSGLALWMSIALVQSLQWFQIARYGQSIGKRVLGIRIVRRFDGKSAGFLQGVVFRDIIPWLVFLACMSTRYTIPLWFVLYVVNFLMMNFNRDSRTIHDLISGTCVMQIGPKNTDYINLKTEGELFNDLEREEDWDHNARTEGDCEEPFRE